VITGFRSWPVAAIYIVAVGALALHLYHGVWSGLQTLGLNHPRYNGYRRAAAIVLSVGLFLGFAAVPVAVLAGVLR
jgi:succinate dehydrogenase / fumarate reductase cytochrome b subunit